jgi:uncharacterized protein YndB with AHSA1/START domain
MDVVKVEAVFDASKSQVWEALTNAEIMKVWYFDISNFKLAVGTEFSFYEGEKKEYLHEGVILKVEQYKVLQHTWKHPEQSKGSSIVTWEIEEIDENKVKVSLSHEGLENFADAGPNFAPANYEMGWNAIVKTNLRNYLYGIKRLIFKQEINASANVVWSTLWDKDSYPKWATIFCEGSYYTGDMAMGNRIHFLTPKGDGMFSDVGYMIPEKLMILSHIGMLLDFKEMPLDAETQRWTGSFEIYKLEEKDGKTTVTAEADCVDKYVSYMEEKFPLALQEIKKISENK